MRYKLTNLMFDFLEKCRVLSDDLALLNLMRETIRPFGIEHFAIAGLPPGHETIRGHFLMNDWPPGWFETYTGRGYVRDDPVVDAIRRHGRAAFWSAAVDRDRLDIRARRVMAEAADAGMPDGYTIPLFSPGRIQAVATFAGSRLGLTSEACSILQIISIQAHDKLIDMRCERDDSVALTPSESECVSWCAAGKTDWEIGRITNRSKRTVNHLIGNACRKLDVVNRPQLIAEAFRRHLQT